MKNYQKPPFQKKAIAIGFTLGIHTVALVGLLFLGMSKPPEPPKQIKTVLIKPEDLKPVTREETEFEETAHENIAEEITQTAEPSVEPAPMVPTAAAPAPPAPQPAPAPHRSIFKKLSKKQKQQSLLAKLPNKQPKLQNVLKPPNRQNRLLLKPKQRLQKSKAEAEAARKAEVEAA